MKFLSVISVGGSRTLSDLVNAGLRNLSFPCVCGGRFLHVQDTWRCMHAACSTHTPLTPTDSTLLAPSSRIYELWSLDPSCHFMYQPNSRIQFRGNMSDPASYLWWQRSFLSPPKLHKTECIYRLRNVTSTIYGMTKNSIMSESMLQICVFPDEIFTTLKQYSWCHI
jgi:hypothetical protein